MTTENTKDSKKQNIEDSIKQNLVYWFLAALVTGFVAGTTSYMGLLGITNQETVIKGSYIRKTELAGPILKNEAVILLDQMIKDGQSFKNKDEMVVWLMEVLTFIQYMGLEKDFDWHGKKMSTIEANIRYAFETPDVQIQVQKTLGILKGFRAGISTRISYP